MHMLESKLIQEVAASAVDLSHQLFRLICKSHQRQWLETNFCLSRYKPDGRFPFTVLQMAPGTVKPVTSARHLLQSRQATECIRGSNPFLLPRDTIPIHTNRDMQTVRSHVATVTGLDDTQKN